MMGSPSGLPPSLDNARSMSRVTNPCLVLLVGIQSIIKHRKEGSNRHGEDFTNNDSLLRAIDCGERFSA